MNVGIDIVEIAQVKQVSNLERFLDKYYSIEEIKYIRHKSVRKEQTIAGIFAAKEAFLKALEIGIGSEISLKDVVVEHKENNAPYILLNEPVLKLLKKYNYSNIDISISHGGEYSIAICNLR